MRAFLSRRSRTLKRASMGAKARTNVRVRAGARPSDAGCKRGVEQPTEVSLKYSDQTPSRPSLKQLPGEVGVGIFTLRPQAFGLSADARSLIFTLKMSSPLPRRPSYRSAAIQSPPISGSTFARYRPGVPVAGWSNGRTVAHDPPAGDPGRDSTFAATKRD